jgi:hypothetical protein
MRFSLPILLGIVAFSAAVTCEATDANAVLWVCKPGTECRPLMPNVPPVSSPARSACRWVLVKGVWTRRCFFAAHVDPRSSAIVMAPQTTCAVGRVADRVFRPAVQDAKKSRTLVAAGSCRIETVFNQ